MFAAYNPDRVPITAQQEEDLLYHIRDDFSGTRRVPPWNDAFPFYEFEDFLAIRENDRDSTEVLWRLCTGVDTLAYGGALPPGMKQDTKALHKPKKRKRGKPREVYLPLLDIVRRENIAESETVGDFLSRDAPGAEMFHAKTMAWRGWSGLLLLEWIMPNANLPKQDSNAVSIPRDFSRYVAAVYHHAMNEYTLASYGGKEAAILEIQKMVTYIYTISIYMWPLDRVMDRRHASARKFYSLIKEISIGSSLFEETHGDKLDEAWVEHYLPYFNIIPRAQELHVERAVVRQAVALNAPIQIDEHQFLVGVRKMVRSVYGDDLDMENEVVFANNKHVAAGMCLAQLLCGSRAKGIIGVNWFSRVDEQLAIETEMKDLLGDARRAFTAHDHCVFVQRMTKQKSKEQQSIAARRAEAKSSGDNWVDIELEDGPVELDKTVVKPILFMLLDASYLNPEEKRHEMTKHDAVTVFLDLMTSIRRYVSNVADRREGKEEKIVLVDAPDHLHPMKGFSDSGTRGHDEFVNGFEVWMRRRMREDFFPDLFPHEEKQPGTHMLRRLYVNWGYKSFGKTTMKETAFAARTLGHSGFGVSLFYTSLIMKPSLSADMALSEAITQRVSLLSAKVEELEAQIDELKEEQKGELQMIAFEDGNGEFVEIEVLPRARRGATVEELTPVVTAKIDEFYEGEVTPTVYKLKRVKLYQKMYAVARAYIIEKDMQLEENEQE